MPGLTMPPDRSAGKMIIDFSTSSYTYVTVYIYQLDCSCRISYIANTAIQISQLPSGFVFSYIKTIGRDCIKTIGGDYINIEFSQQLDKWHNFVYKLKCRVTDLKWLYLVVTPTYNMCNNNNIMINNSKCMYRVHRRIDNNEQILE